MANPNVMEEFVDLIRDSNILTQEVLKSQQAIYMHQKLLTENTEKLGSINRQILEKLERMDVLQAGNAGWQARTLNFLLTYRQHVSGSGE